MSSLQSEATFAINSDGVGDAKELIEIEDWEPLQNFLRLKHIEGFLPVRKFLSRVNILMINIRPFKFILWNPNPINFVES